MKKKKGDREPTFKQVCLSLTHAILELVHWLGSSIKRLIEFSNNNWRGMVILIAVVLGGILLIKNPGVITGAIALFVNIWAS